MTSHFLCLPPPCSLVTSRSSLPAPHLRTETRKAVALQSMELHFPDATGTVGATRGGWGKICSASKTKEMRRPEIHHKFKNIGNFGCSLKVQLTVSLSPESRIFWGTEYNADTRSTQESLQKKDSGLRKQNHPIGRCLLCSFYLLLHDDSTEFLLVSSWWVISCLSLFVLFLPFSNENANQTPGPEGLCYCFVFSWCF